MLRAQSPDFDASLQTLHFHITPQCLFRCKHCSVEAGPNRTQRPLALPIVKGMIDDAVTLGSSELDISGGDPLTVERQDLLGITDYACQQGMQVTISTNGYLLTDVVAKELAGAGVEKLKFSIHGATANSHDSFTGVPGSLDRLLRGIQASKEVGIEVWLNAVVTPENSEEMGDLPVFLRDIDIDLLQVSTFVECGRGGRMVQLTDAQMEEAIEALSKALGGMDYVFTITLYPEPSRPPFLDRYCDYLVERLAVDPNGHVIPCCLLPGDLQDRLGNVKDGLLKLYNPQAVSAHPVFEWLIRGHEAMRRHLGYEKFPHNLCSACIDMLRALRDAAGAGTGPDPMR